MPTTIRLVLLFFSIASLFFAHLSQAASLPPGEAGAKAALNASPRHHEWVQIALPGTKKTLSAYLE